MPWPWAGICASMTIRLIAPAPGARQATTSACEELPDFDLPGLPAIGDLRFGRGESREALAVRWTRACNDGAHATAKAKRNMTLAVYALDSPPLDGEGLGVG